MAVKCKDILSLPTLKKLTLIAGEAGLDRVVTWPYIVQTNSIKLWIFGGELLFFSGLGIRNDRDSLLELLIEAAERNASGIIFLANEEMTSETILSLQPVADELQLPIFEIPRESIIVDITKEISNKIFEEENKGALGDHKLERLFYGNEESLREFASKATYLGIDLKVPYQTAALYIDNLETYLSRMNIGQNTSLPKFVSFYQQVALSIVKGYDGELLAMVDQSSVIISQQVASDAERQRFSHKVQSICDNINSYFKGLEVYACIGGPYVYQEIKQSLQEAERTKEITRKLKSRKRIALYSELGVYQLFFNMRESDLVRFSDRWIGPMLEYDRKNGADLIRTLEVFFDSRMNLVDTAAKLYIHRNTLNVRMSRIEKIIGASLKDTETLHGLLFSTLIYKYLNRTN